MSRTKTFVLVHGAWHGGWCWSAVAAILRSRGHAVLTPTQTGLGERRHLMSKAITLDTFIEDITNVIDFERLDDIVLVGHSFGGNTISGVADFGKGSPANPMSFEEVAGKFRECAEFAAWDKAKAEDVVGMVRDMESLPSLDRLLAALSKR